MDFLELVKRRVSVRNYDPEKKVPYEIILRIIEAGRFAPSAVNLQPWQFIVVSNPKILEKIKQCYQRTWLQDAPHILIVKGFHDKAWVRKYDGYNSLETDLAIAMDHIILAATAEGVSTCWIEAFQYPLLASAMGLKDNEMVFAITPLGYPKPDYKPSGMKERKPVGEIALFI